MTPKAEHPCRNIIDEHVRKCTEHVKGGGALGVAWRRLNPGLASQDGPIGEPGRPLYGVTTPGY